MAASRRRADAWRAMWPAVASVLASSLIVVLLVALLTGSATGSVSAAGAAGICRSARSGLRSTAARARAQRAGGRRATASRRDSQRAQATALCRAALALLRSFRHRGDALAGADNFQDDPAPVVALRTSPTNIGLQLLAMVSAYDLGFITVRGRWSDRLELAFRSLERLRRFRGPLLQLVRSARPARARAGLHLHRGQREPGRSSDRAAPGVPRAGRPTHVGPGPWTALETALGLAHEASRPLGPAGAAIEPRLRGALAEVATLARITAPLGGAGPGTMPSADALAATAVRLQEVREILATAGLSSEASHAIGQWLALSAQLIAAHRPREAAVSDAETGPGSRPD